MANLVKVLRAGSVYSSTTSNGEVVSGTGLVTCNEDDTTGASIVVSKAGGSAPAHATISHGNTVGH